MNRPLSIEPIIGDWYLSHGLLFEVVAIDEAEGLIEIQHADGDIEELENDDWRTRSLAGSLQLADPPEDAHLAEDHDQDVTPQPAPVAMLALQETHGSPLEEFVEDE